MPPLRTPQLASLVVGLGAIVAAGCGAAARFEGGTYSAAYFRYHVGTLPAPWRRVYSGEANLVFRHPDGGTIAANATCRESDDVPLDALTNHLLVGITDRRPLARTELVLDGRAALRTEVEGRVDGVPVDLDLVVVKKDGCIYDLQLVAGLPTYAARRGDFDTLVAGFAALGPAAPLGAAAR